MLALITTILSKILKISLMTLTMIVMKTTTEKFDCCGTEVYPTPPETCNQGSQLNRNHDYDQDHDNVSSV